MPQKKGSLVIIFSFFFFSGWGLGGRGEGFSVLKWRCFFFPNNLMLCLRILLLYAVIYINWSSQPDQSNPPPHHLHTGSVTDNEKLGMKYVHMKNESKEWGPCCSRLVLTWHQPTHPPVRPSNWFALFLVPSQLISRTVHLLKKQGNIIRCFNHNLSTALWPCIFFFFFYREKLKLTPVPTTLAMIIAWPKTTTI